MHSFKECCHLGQRSAGEFSVGLKVSYIHIFHIFKFKSSTRMSASLKADCCRSERWHAGRGEIVGCRRSPCTHLFGQSLSAEEKPDYLYFNSTLVFPAERSGVVFFFHTLIQVGLSRSSCPSKKSLPKHRVWVLCCNALYSSQSTLWPLKCILLRVGGCIFNYLRWFSFPLVKETPDESPCTSPRKDGTADD